MCLEVFISSRIACGRCAGPLASRQVNLILTSLSPWQARRLWTFWALDSSTGRRKQVYRDDYQVSRGCAGERRRHIARRRGGGGPHPSRQASLEQGLRHSPTLSLKSTRHLELVISYLALASRTRHILSAKQHFIASRAKRYLSFVVFQFQFQFQFECCSCSS